MNVSLKHIFLAVYILICGCNYETKNTRLVSIFFDPSTTYFNDKYHFTAQLNGKVVIDSIISNTHVAGSLIVHCLRKDTNQKNIFKLTVQNKSKELNLNNYHSKCIELFSHYDDRTKIRNQFDAYQELSIKTTGTIPDYKKYIDSVKSTGTLSHYDSLAVSIQTDKCWCDPKADHHENKGFVPGIIYL